MSKPQKPHRYKEKKCPICGTLHKKRWECCSVECGVERRLQTPVTEQAKQNRREGLIKWKQTPQGEATNANLVNFDNEEQAAILPPINTDSPFFVEDGDVWTLA